MRRLLPCLVAIAACSDDAASPSVEVDAHVDGQADSAVEIDGIPTIAETTVADDTTATEVAGETTEGLEVIVDPPLAPDVYLTIADVPPEMNGSVPSGELTWRLRANRAHVSLDVVALRDSGPITSASIACLADGQSHPIPTVSEVAPGHWRAWIDDASAFPDGAVITCEANVLGPGGSGDASYSFDVATLPPALDPFPATDEWLIVLTRDIFDLVVTPHPDGTAQLRSDYLVNGNGVLDFDEPFFELGLFSTEHPEAAAIVKAHLLSKVRAELYRIYGLDAAGAPAPGGVPLHIWFEGDDGAPDALDYGGARRFSMIALGGDGDLEDQAGGTFGRALIDYNNQETEDDTVYGLGVFPTGLARQVLALDVGIFLLEGYRPRQGGVAFGDDPDDALFIGKDLTADDMPAGSNALQRIDVYNLFVRFGALGLASILAHEMGHSLGLVPSGLPPEGLFAGVQTDFTVTLAPDAHIDTEGLNIMQTGGSVNWLDAVSGEEPRFEPLSWAYLTRQLVVGALP